MRYVIDIVIPSNFGNNTHEPPLPVSIKGKFLNVSKIKNDETKINN